MVRVTSNQKQAVKPVLVNRLPKQEKKHQVIPQDWKSNAKKTKSRRQLGHASHATAHRSQMIAKQNV